MRLPYVESWPLHCWKRKIMVFLVSRKISYVWIKIKFCIRRLLWSWKMRTLNTVFRTELTCLLYSCLLFILARANTWNESSPTGWFIVYMQENMSTVKFRTSYSPLIVKFYVQTILFLFYGILHVWHLKCY